MSNNGKNKISRLRSAMYSRQVPPSFGEEKRHKLPTDTSDIPLDWNTKKEEVRTAGSVVSPRAMRYTRTALWWTFTLAALFFIISAGMFAWYVFGGFGNGVRSDNIDISVNGPISVVGGEPVDLEIVITNRNKAPLEFADLVVVYPVGTRSVADFSTDLPQQRISLGTIEAGGTKKGTVSAVLVGQGGQPSQVLIEVEYQVLGTSAIFVASEVYDFIFSATPITVSIESQTEVIPGQPIDIVATVSANTSNVLRNVLLELEAPFGFTLTGASPTPTSGSVWSLGDIRPGDSKVIRLRGVMKGQSGDVRVFRFSVGTPLADSDNEIGVPIAQSVQQITITQPFIALEMGVNRKITKEAAVVSPGSTVSVTIDWQNELDTPITNVVMVASLNGLGIAQDLIKTNDGFYHSVDNTIRWDAQTTFGKFSEISPGESGSVGFSFVVPSDVSLVGVRNPSLNISVNAKGDRSDSSTVPEDLKSSEVRIIRVETTPTVVSHGFYHTNPYGVKGVVPPKVNNETAYAILWTAGNSTNPIESAEVTAQLPSYVRWMDVFSPSREDVTFDQNTRTVTWKIGSISAGAGESGVPVKQVSFEIGLTPSASQIGQEPVLVINQVFSGTDAYTGTPVGRKLKDTSTRQQNDQGFVASDAKVVQ